MMSDDPDAPIDRDALLAIFFATAEETLVEVEEALLSLEETPDDDEVLKTALRGLHTLKGNAATVALDEVALLNHVLEEPLARIRSGALRITPATTTFLLTGLDAIRERIWGEQQAAPQTVVASAPPEDARDRAPARRPSYAGIRVAPERADKMLSLVTELAIGRAQIEEHLRRGDARGVEGALARYRDSERLHVELEEIVMKLRMVPIEPVLRQYGRTVRDAAARCEKAASLVVDARGVELDGAVVEQLRDPLLHMVRNAVDHGIEPAEVRVARGKPPEGRVTLRAFHDAGSVVVQVEDDGGGLDRARILAHARERGLLRDDEEPSDEQRILCFILEPGFSTARAITDVSGRGVGLDVVAQRVESLRGRIEVDNGPSGGARISIRLPLTLAIIDGFAVSAGRETFIIPSGAVDEFVDARALGDARRTGGVLRWRGAPIPLVPLAHLFELDAAREAPQAVVVHHAGGRAALGVDAIQGASRSVIRPLRGLARTSEGIAGSTLVGGGRVAYVLDVPAVLERAGARRRARAMSDEGMA